MYSVKKDALSKYLLAKKHTNSSVFQQRTLELARKNIDDYIDEKLKYFDTVNKM